MVLRVDFNVRHQLVHATEVYPIYLSITSSDNTPKISYLCICASLKPNHLSTYVGGSYHYLVGFYGAYPNSNIELKCWMRIIKSKQT
jgi:hypothetical protein